MRNFKSKISKFFWVGDTPSPHLTHCDLRPLAIPPPFPEILNPPLSPSNRGLALQGLSCWVLNTLSCVRVLLTVFFSSREGVYCICMCIFSLYGLPVYASITRHHGSRMQPVHQQDKNSVHWMKCNVSQMYVSSYTGMLSWNIGGHCSIPLMKCTTVAGGTGTILARWPSWQFQSQLDSNQKPKIHSSSSSSWHLVSDTGWLGGCLSQPVLYQND